jgi:hypothetical protein
VIVGAALLVLGAQVASVIPGDGMGNPDNDDDDLLADQHAQIHAKCFPLFLVMAHYGRTRCPSSHYVYDAVPHGHLLRHVRHQIRILTVQV